MKERNKKKKRRKEKNSDVECYNIVEVKYLSAAHNAFVGFPCVHFVFSLGFFAR